MHGLSRRSSRTADGSRWTWCRHDHEANDAWSAGRCARRSSAQNHLAAPPFPRCERKPAARCCPAGSAHVRVRAHEESWSCSEMPVVLDKQLAGGVSLRAVCSVRMPALLSLRGQKAVEKALESGERSAEQKVEHVVQREANRAREEDRPMRTLIESRDRAPRARRHCQVPRKNVLRHWCLE